MISIIILSPFLNVFYFRRARGNSVEKPSKNRLNAIRRRLGGMQLKIQTNLKESSMVELFYLKSDWSHNALGEYIWNISYIPPLPVWFDNCCCCCISNNSVYLLYISEVAISAGREMLIVLTDSSKRGRF
jgi:hypothetical protein